MDSDPRVIEINKQIRKIQEKIQRQQEIIQESHLLGKISEWRKLRKLENEYEKKIEFKEKLISTIKRKANRKKKKTVKAELT